MSGALHVYGASFATSTRLRDVLAASLPGVSVLLHGVSGATLARWSATIPTDRAYVGDTVVVLELGGNGAPSAADVRATDAELYATGAARVVWLAFDGWPSTAVASKRRDAARIVAANAREAYVLPMPSAEHVAGDGVHLTAAGYAALATAAVAKLASDAAGDLPSTRSLVALAFVLLVVVWGVS